MPSKIQNLGKRLLESMVIMKNIALGPKDTGASKKSYEAMMRQGSLLALCMIELIRQGRVFEDCQLGEYLISEVRLSGRDITRKTYKLIFTASKLISGIRHTEVVTAIVPFRQSHDLLDSSTLAAFVMALIREMHKVVVDSDNDQLRSPRLSAMNFLISKIEVLNKHDIFLDPKERNALNSSYYVKFKGNRFVGFIARNSQYTLSKIKFDAANIMDDRLLLLWLAYGESGQAGKEQIHNDRDRDNEMRDSQRHRATVLEDILAAVIRGDYRMMKMDESHDSLICGKSQVILRGVNASALDKGLKDNILRRLCSRICFLLGTVDIVEVRDALKEARVLLERTEDMQGLSRICQVIRTHLADIDDTLIPSSSIYTSSGLYEFGLSDIYHDVIGLKDKVDIQELSRPEDLKYLIELVRIVEGKSYSLRDIGQDSIFVKVLDREIFLQKSDYVLIDIKKLVVHRLMHIVNMNSGPLVDDIRSKLWMINMNDGQQAYERFGDIAKVLKDLG